MEEGLRKLYSGDFNYLSQEQEGDAIVITLSKEGEGKTYQFKVKDLYGENEEVLEHKVIPHQAPKWIKDRMKEAKRSGDKSKPKS